MQALRWWSDLDGKILVWISSERRENWSAALATALTEAGKTPTYLLVVLAVAALNGPAALFLLTMLLVAELSNRILKGLIPRERPCAADPERAGVGRFDGRHSFPSAHAQTAAAVWGSIAWLSQGVLPISACALLVLAIGWSRIRLAAHFPSDVVAGWIAGLLQLTIAAALLAPARTWP